MSVIVTPIENVKAKLQVQYALPPGATPLYRGPIDCVRKVLKAQGIRGLYAGMKSPRPE